MVAERKSSGSEAVPPIGGKASGAAPSRSKRGSGGKRNRGRQMDSMTKVFAAVEKHGARGKEFGTTDIVRRTELSPGSVYGWLMVFRRRGWVEARFDESVRPTGGWRWKTKFRLVKL